MNEGNEVGKREPAPATGPLSGPLSGKPQAQGKGNRDRRGFLLGLGSLLLLPALPLKPVTAATTFKDLKAEIVSFNPFTVKLPASTLVPLLLAEINAQPGRSGNTDTQRYSVGEVYLELRDNEVYVKSKVSAGRRGFTTVFGSRIYTPWASASFRVQAKFALSVENFVVKASETYLDIDSSNDLVDAIIRTFADSIYGNARQGLKQALEGISGQDLRVQLTKLLEDQGGVVPPTTRLDVRVQPDGLYIILGS